MLAVSVKARETVDCESPSRLARTSAVTSRVRRFAAFGFLMSASTKMQPRHAASNLYDFYRLPSHLSSTSLAASVAEPLELHNDRKTGWKNSDCYGRFTRHRACGCQTFSCRWRQPCSDVPA